MIIITDNMSLAITGRPIGSQGLCIVRQSLNRADQSNIKAKRINKHPRSRRKREVTKESSENEDGIAVVNGKRYILHCCRWQKVRKSCTR